jgi:hypothetical protein
MDGIMMLIRVESARTALDVTAAGNGVVDRILVAGGRTLGNARPFAMLREG